MLKNQDGFTLMELILVIAILAIIAAIALPNLTFGIKEARLSSDRSNARLIADSMQRVITADNGVSRVDINPALVYEEDVPDATSDDIEQLIELSVDYIQTVPLVKYGDTNGSNFYVEIGAASGIRVLIDDDPTAVVNLIEIYPNPSGEWELQ